MRTLILGSLLWFSLPVFAEHRQICIPESNRENCFWAEKGDATSEPALLSGAISISGRDFKTEFHDKAQFQWDLKAGETLILESELPFCLHRRDQKRCLVKSKGGEIRRGRFFAKDETALQADFGPFREREEYHIRIDRAVPKPNPFDTGDRYADQGEDFMKDHLDLYDLPKNCPHRYRMGSDAHFEIQLSAGEKVALTNGVNASGAPLHDPSRLHLYIVKGDRCVAYFSPETSGKTRPERVVYEARRPEKVTVVAEYDDFVEGYSSSEQSGNGYGFLIERLKAEEKPHRGGKSCQNPLKLSFDAAGMAEIEGDALDRDFPSAMPPRCKGRLRPLTMALDLKKGEGIRLVESTHRVIFMERCTPGKKPSGIWEYPGDTEFDGLEPADRDRTVYVRLEFDAECTLTEAEVEESSSGEGVGTAQSLMEKGCAAHKCHMDDHRSYRVRLQKTVK